jgi:hypothetical protein
MAAAPAEISCWAGGVVETGRGAGAAEGEAEGGGFTNGLDDEADAAGAAGLCARATGARPASIKK